MDPAGPETLNLHLSGAEIAAGTVVTLNATADDTRYDANGWPGAEPVQAIADSRFSVDSPAWVSGTVTLPLTPVDGNFNSTIEDLEGTIDTSGWSPGQHTVFVESLDADGHWGVPTAVFLTVTVQGYQPGIEPDAQSGEALLGSNMIYTLTVTNLGSDEDTFDVQVSGNIWQTEFSPGPVGPLGPGANAQLDVSVTVPGTASQGEEDVATITVVSQGDSSRTATATLTTTAIAPAIFLPSVQK
jgi:hypothetical protein